MSTQVPQNTITVVDPTDGDAVDDVAAWSGFELVTPTQFRTPSNEFIDIPVGHLLVHSSQLVMATPMSPEDVTANFGVTL